QNTGGSCEYPHFADRDTEAWSSKGLWLGLSHSRFEMQRGPESRFPEPRMLVPTLDTFCDESRVPMCHSSAVVGRGQLKTRHTQSASWKLSPKTSGQEGHMLSAPGRHSQQRGRGSQPGGPGRLPGGAPELSH
ncbi:hypothetical protein H1C71_017987, partial [Ictidomys tridecemlineatus]